jgi:hypothetical protein
MIGYERVGLDLGMVIDDHVFDAQHELPFWSAPWKTL